MTLFYCKQKLQLRLTFYCEIPLNFAKKFMSDYRHFNFEFFKIESEFRIIFDYFKDFDVKFSIKS